MVVSMVFLQQQPKKVQNSKVLSYNRKG
jgi:hypothetical protein